MTIINVTDIPREDVPLVKLCRHPQPLDKGMYRCDRAEGHLGLHSWELIDAAAVRTQVESLYDKELELFLEDAGTSPAAHKAKAAAFLRVLELLDGLTKIESEEDDA